MKTSAMSDISKAQTKHWQGKCGEREMLKDGITSSPSKADVLKHKLGL
jgi:hypothetical protein